MKTILLCLLLISTSCMAQVFKCPGTAGKTIYSDIPCSPAAEVIRITPSGGFIVPKRNSDADAPHAGEAAPIECRFEHFSFGDDKGKALAQNATKECMRNIRLKKEGRGQEVTMVDYQVWRDHSQMKNSQRNSSKTMNCVANGFGGVRCN